MLRGVNSSTIIFILMVMVVSCSASKSITNTIQVQDSGKTYVQRLDSITAQSLRPEEKLIKKEIIKSVNSLPTENKSSNSDAIMATLENQTKMLVDIFGLFTASRMRNDSLEWDSRNKDATIKEIKKLIKAQKESEEMGRSVQDQISTIPKIFVTILVTLLAIAGIILWVHRNLSNQLRKSKKHDL